jgi:hypothetical protein
MVKHQRVTIDRGLGHDVRGNRAAPAAAVVDHQRLAQRPGHLLPHHACNEIGGAAGRERDHEADGFVGVGAWLGCVHRGFQRLRVRHARGKCRRHRGYNAGLPSAQAANLPPCGGTHPPPAQKNTNARISMLCRGGAPAGVAGSMKAVCAVKRARPSLAES